MKPKIGDLIVQTRYGKILIDNEPGVIISLHDHYCCVYRFRFEDRIILYFTEFSKM